MAYQSIWDDSPSAVATPTASGTPTSGYKSIWSGSVAPVAKTATVPVSSMNDEIAQQSAASIGTAFAAGKTLSKTTPQQAWPDYQASSPEKTSNPKKIPALPQGSTRWDKMLNAFGIDPSSSVDVSGSTDQSLLKNEITMPGYGAELSKQYKGDTSLPGRIGSALGAINTAIGGIHEIGNLGKNDGKSAVSKIAAGVGGALTANPLGAAVVGALSQPEVEEFVQPVFDTMKLYADDAKGVIRPVVQYLPASWQTNVNDAIDNVAAAIPFIGAALLLRGAGGKVGETAKAARTYATIKESTIPLSEIQDVFRTGGTKRATDFVKKTPRGELAPYVKGQKAATEFTPREWVAKVDQLRGEFKADPIGFIKKTLGIDVMKPTAQSEALTKPSGSLSKLTNTATGKIIIPPSITTPGSGYKSIWGDAEEASPIQEAAPVPVEPNGSPIIPEANPIEAKAETPLAPEEITTIETKVPEVKTSKIGKSIEAKAVEAKLTKGFENTAGYESINIKDQATKATKLINDSYEEARSIIRGDAPLPEGLKGTSLIAAMEEHIKKNPSPELAYELANSPLITGTSEAAQELRLAAERDPDSATAKLVEIKKAREAKVEKITSKKQSAEKKSLSVATKKMNLAKEEASWDKFIEDITC